MEDDLQWKKTLGGRRPLVEEDLRGKKTFGGRWPSVEDDLWWKTTFSGRRTLVENDLLWKTTFSGKLPSVEDDLWWILACCLHCFVAFIFILDLSFLYWYSPNFGNKIKELFEMRIQMSLKKCIISLSYLSLKLKN